MSEQLPRITKLDDGRLAIDIDSKIRNLFQSR